MVSSEVFSILDTIFEVIDREENGDWVTPVARAFTTGARALMTPVALFRDIFWIILAQRFFGFLWVGFFTSVPELGLLICYWCKPAGFVSPEEIASFDLESTEDLSFSSPIDVFIIVITVLILVVRFVRGVLLELYRIRYARQLHVLNIILMAVMNLTFMTRYIFYSNTKVLLFEMVLLIGHFVDLTICKPMLYLHDIIAVENIRLYELLSGRDKLNQLLQHPVLLDVEEECFICYSVIKRVIVLKCKHQIHDECLKQLIEHSSTQQDIKCPVCRTRIA